MMILSSVFWDSHFGKKKKAQKKGPCEVCLCVCVSVSSATEANVKPLVCVFVCVSLLEPPSCF